MSAKTYRLWYMVIVFALAAFFAWSIIAEMPLYVPIVGVVVALLLMNLLMNLYRRLTKEIMVDERLHKINEKASATSYRISSVLMAIIGITFIVMRNTLPSEYEIVGLTLAYSVCVIMLIHLGFYYYYKSKL